ncbi:MAG: response regulator [Kiloniellaceae bacterium]
MTDKVLFVDDDPQILSAFKRGLRKRFAVTTAEGGAAGLELLKKEGPFAVVVSDQQMPEMDGVTFLKQVKQKSPMTVRMMLTGNADQKTAIDAVNDGQIFRFLNKPCEPKQLAVAVEAAQAHYRLLAAERELLEKTLAGSIKVLTDVLALIDASAFQQTARLQRWGHKLARFMRLENAWALNMTIMLHGIGRITLPREVTQKLRDGTELSAIEAEMVARTPEAARDLIKNIPRLEGVAQAVYYRAAGYDGSGFPGDGMKGEDLPLEARILRILSDLANASEDDRPAPVIFARMAKAGGLYDHDLLKSAYHCLAKKEEATKAKAAPEVLKVELHNLNDSHQLAEDVMTETDVLVLAKGHRLTRPMIEKLRAYHKLRKIRQPLSVIVIEEDEEDDDAERPQTEVADEVEVNA